MRQIIKRFLSVGVLVFGLSSAWAFSLIGPVGNGVAAGGIVADTWQVQGNGFNPLVWSDPLNFLDSLPVGPKNLGEGYRQNVPVMIYAYDAGFLNFFGSNGVAAVDQTYSLLNTLTNVDSYSPGLAEFPLNSERQNYAAANWGLLDVKSITLALMMEQLGLADAIRYAWVLHDRFPIPGATCVISPGGVGAPGMDYRVVQRNYDINPSPVYQPDPNALEVQVQYSYYINGCIFYYQIAEYCGRTPDPAPLTADAIEQFDPFAINPPVASGVGSGYLPYGAFYTGLTRDDAAGLRYLMSSNNLSTETPALGSLLEQTNFTTHQLLYTSNLTSLAVASQTNTAAGLQALYPGLVITSVSNYFALVITTNVVIYQTNLIGSPVGTLSTIVAFNRVTNIQEFFSYTFGNVIILHTNATTPAQLQTITVAPPNGSPAGSPPVTTVSTKNIVLTNYPYAPSGDFYIFPAGTCGYSFIQLLQTIVIPVTNNLLTAVNGNLFYSQNVITYFTNHVYEVAPCALVAPGPALYQGIQKIQFVRANFDSLLGQTFQPLTNSYSMVTVTNSHPVRLQFQRVVTAPDFLLDAADISPGPAGDPGGNLAFLRSITFNQANILPGQAGPGTIEPGVTFTLNKVGTLYINQSPDLVNGAIYGRDFLWGSFDTSTNIVVYPNGTSIANLIAEVLMQIYPATLPAGTHNVVYPTALNPTVTISASGGQTPYTWSASGLPPGLNLDPNTGVLSGTPGASGSFAVTVQMTDAGGRTVAMNYSLTIN